MARHAVINEKGEVVNVIEWDGQTPWQCPDGHYTIESEICDSKDTFDKETHMFSKICNGKSYHKKTTYHEYINDTNNCSTLTS